MSLPASLLRTSIAGAVFAAAAFNVASNASAADAPARMPEVTSKQEILSDSDPVGPTARPEWTSHRRFASTRVYIQKDPGEVGVEQWWRIRNKNGETKHLLQSEVEIGLPFRMQLDLYENIAIDEDGNADHDNFATELRYAFADWGKIFLNPALYAEYKFVDQGADVFEGKLLLGTDITPTIHYGLNLIYEQELGDARAIEVAASQGLNFTLIDGTLSAGVEMKFVHETEAGSRGDAEIKFLVGPSVQIKPTRNTHLDLVSLFGTTDDSEDVEAYVIFGFDFGGGKSHYAPASVRSN